ncbi:MAG TPA: hypothetical protein VK735_47740 [Pseudonocardia sp.]|uniref:hypothetical protein n=1 Tax=Pseudonocardia sp. TaxID=60912 RepID=UPI002D1E11A6|nr:hypothetical protein [Pseudonocardia sp.]HTF55187.1 hypothetical protein [Pseudonocardia sp.]
MPPEPVAEPAGLEPTWLAPVVGLLPVLVPVLVLVGLLVLGVFELVLDPNSKVCSCASKACSCSSKD